MRKILQFKKSGKKKGNVGEQTELIGFNVGDVVAFDYRGYSRGITTSVICNDGNGSSYVMGLKGVKLSDLLYKHKMTKVVSYENLTQSILDSVRDCIELVEVDYVEMTQQEIENVLGYKVKIIS